MPVKTSKRGNVGTKQSLTARKAYAQVMLQEGVTHQEICKTLGMSYETIQKIKKGQTETFQALAEGIKNQEHNSLQSIGFLARTAVKQKLERIIELGAEDNTPLIPLVAVMDRAFQQRRTLEGEASVIFDHKHVSATADQRRRRLERLQAKRRELVLRPGSDGVHSVDPSERSDA